MIDNINSPKDIKKLNIDGLNLYAKEVREFLINTVSKTGGHLASNLGVVELTIALHYMFDSPIDKIIWDVGHQTYVHKLITGRKFQFDNLRKFKGLSGFPKHLESEHDVFNTGHSSTSISAAVGMARARDIKGEKNYVIAVIGDSSLTGGMALEALNDAGHSENNLIVILNDNQMSISKNVGGMSRYLNTLRTARSYNYIKRSITTRLGDTPKGKKLALTLKHFKDRVKHLFLQDTLFDSLGFTYFGPFDGHNIEELIKILSRVKKMNGKFLIHVRTTKGKGYEPAEINPHIFHRVSKFNIKNGVLSKNKAIDYSTTFGKAIIELATTNKDIVAITASMTEGTGLSEFSEKFPDRFFDVGIAEQHAVTMAAGLAMLRLTPIVALYSSFMQRAYDQILHDVAMQNLHVTFCIDRAGIVGADGETHQGIYDIAYLSHIPNITMLAPSTFNELEIMLEYAVLINNGPTAIRYPKGSEAFEIEHKSNIEHGRGELIIDGDDVAILAIGNMVSCGVEVCIRLKENNINASLVDLRFIKPIDIELIIKQCKKAKIIVTMEDGIILGGIGEQITNLLYQNAIYKKIIIKAFPDTIIEQGSIQQLMCLYKLDCESITNDVLKELQ